MISEVVRKKRKLVFCSLGIFFHHPGHGGLRCSALLLFLQPESRSQRQRQGVRRLVLTILLHGSECWSLREDLYDRLRVFHNRCVRTLCRVKMRQVHRHMIKQDTLNARVGLQSLDYYYSTRLLRWAGHVSRMPWHRTPRKLLTSWVRHKRPVGAQRMTYGRTLNKALKSAGISTLAATWMRKAQDRNAWRDRTHTKLKLKI